MPNIVILLVYYINVHRPRPVTDYKLLYVYGSVAYIHKQHHFDVPTIFTSIEKMKNIKLM